MIDYGTYQVQKDDNGEFVVEEQLSGRATVFPDIASVARFIEQDLNDVVNGNG